MSFRRTSLGLRNQPVFFESDIVVYVEGRNLQEAKVEQDTEGDAVTQDSIFWSGVIRKVLPGAKLHFKALGSKTELIKLSSGLDEKVRGKLLICVDRDFDDVLPRTVQLNFAISSYRYSWEADIWMWVVFVRVLTGLLPSEGVPQKVLEKARYQRDRFFRETRKLVRLDVQTVSVKGVGCFIPRDNPSSVVKLHNGVPQLNKGYFRARAKLYRKSIARPWRPGVIGGVDCKRHFFGKAVDRFHCQLLVCSVKDIGFAGAIPFFVLQNAAIRTLPEVLSDPQRVSQLRHYHSEVNAAL